MATYPPNHDSYQKHSSSAPATGVPVSPHHYPHHQPHLQGAWSSGLCDCCSDVKNCCITCWCPCITFGQIAEIVDKGTTGCGTSGALYGLLQWFTGCACLYSCLYRSKLRRQYMLHETPCNDCLVHCCCETCALCQEYRELQSRGFDMSLGWQENMARQNGVAMAAPTATAPMFEGAMNR